MNIACTYTIGNPSEGCDEVVSDRVKQILNCYGRSACKTSTFVQEEQQQCVTISKKQMRTLTKKSKATQKECDICSDISTEQEFSRAKEAQPKGKPEWHWNTKEGLAELALHSNIVNQKLLELYESRERFLGVVHTSRVRIPTRDPSRKINGW